MARIHKEMISTNSFRGDALLRGELQRDTINSILKKKKKIEGVLYTRSVRNSFLTIQCFIGLKVTVYVVLSKQSFCLVIIVCMWVCAVCISTLHFTLDFKVTW